MRSLKMAKMKMVKGPDGKMVPDFAADGKGKMASGGMMKTKMNTKGGMKGGGMMKTKMNTKGGMKGGGMMKTKGYAKGGMKTKGYSKGGKVRGAGIARQGVRPARII